MMRYMLYESEQGNTRLSREIEFMKGYIDLMKLRLSDRVRLMVSFPENYEDQDLPPLLFIPFIENAFKHGVSAAGGSFIDIALGVEGGMITLIANNSISSRESGGPRVDSGIGLDNVRKRLALLYPGRHDLRIDHQEKIYSVKLTVRQ
jgi:LytS/YehU family sensor histidine kinase